MQSELAALVVLTAQDLRVVHLAVAAAHVR
jgi:hypothetical protein